MATASRKTVKKRKAKSKAKQTAKSAVKSKAKKAAKKAGKSAASTSRAKGGSGARKAGKTASKTAKKAARTGAKKSVKKAAKAAATAAKKPPRSASKTVSEPKLAPEALSAIKRAAEAAAAALAPAPRPAAKPRPAEPVVTDLEDIAAASVAAEHFEMVIVETIDVEAVEPAVAPVAPPERKTFYITTAIAYPNGNPHIGHAYEAIATDALARFQRLDGKDVFFLTGTDEHGLKMIQTAENEGLTPHALATRNAGRFKEMDERLNVSFDRFIRTTEEQHHRSSQEIWRRMADNGDIYLDSYSGWYSVRDEAYYAEEETTLGEDNVRRGPQGTPVEWVEEKSYFFRLSAYQDRLLDLYAEQPDFIGPESRRNEVVSFVRSGLRDLSVSRTTFDWGVKVPGDPEHVMYVWVDALTNYITGAGFPDENDSNWRYWPADVHIIGKDIIRFHAVYWPAFLMSAGIAVPKRVYAHGFLFNRGEKMSKSVGNVVDPFNLADQYGVDQMRYFFLREVPFGQDGNYNHEAIV
ncbi:MAG TPA: methionine--tRNA ligase, partial [Bradyrhizobium sp.]|nr:methionine--tRNA ligase [Bradyrhizobium sp.]